MWQKSNPTKRRNSRLLYQYGLTIEDYNKLLNLQNGLCAICGTENPLPHCNFTVDHNHTTGNIRGLLCHKCNKAIGLLQDSHEICLAAAKYLEGK
jgi:hypothetical protein